MTSHWFFRQGRNVEREAVSLGGLLDIDQNLTTSPVGTFRTCRDIRVESAFGGKPDLTIATADFRF